MRTHMEYIYIYTLNLPSNMNNYQFDNDNPLKPK